MESGISGLRPGVDMRHLAAIVESSDDAILTKDTNAVIMSWNAAAERLYGWKAAEAIGQPVSIIVPRHRKGEERQILARIVRGERVDHYETERVHKEGRRVVVSLSVSPLRDERDEIVGASVIARDITEQERARRRAELLQSVTLELSRSLTPDHAMDVLVADGARTLGADAAVVGLVSADGASVELAASSGYSDGGLAGWERIPIETDVPLSYAVRRGEALWIESAAEVAGRFPALAGTEFRFEALAVVPLTIEGRPIGALALSFAERRSFGLEDRAFILAAAQQAGQVLERGRLYDSERRARERVAFIAGASEVLSESLDLDDTLQRLASIAVPQLGDWCAIDLGDSDGGIRQAAVAHRDRDRVQWARELRQRYPPDPAADVGAAKVLRTGESEVYAEISDELLAAAAQDEEHLRLMRELELRSAMIVPLKARGRTLGAVTLVSAESGRRYGREDLRLAEDLGRHAALAIDNALLYRRERDAAVMLQRALLPRSLPEVPGLRLASRYFPAGAGVEAGGDWFDVVVAERRLNLVMGDVAGRGITAAAVMGRLRIALRAYVLDGYPTAAAVERLHRLMRSFDDPEMATIFHLEHRIGSHSASYVRAGHPPALLRTPGGEVAELTGRGSPPVGVPGDPRFVPNMIDLRPGSLVLLYTDGLIERRRGGIDPGLERLKEALAAGPDTPEECLDAIAADFDCEATADDVALLALRLDGEGGG